MLIAQFRDSDIGSGEMQEAFKYDFITILFTALLPTASIDLI